MRLTYCLQWLHQMVESARQSNLLQQVVRDQAQYWCKKNCNKRLKSINVCDKSISFCRLSLETWLRNIHNDRIERSCVPTMSDWCICENKSDITIGSGIQQRLELFLESYQWRCCFSISFALENIVCRFAMVDPNFICTNTLITNTFKNKIPCVIKWTALGGLILLKFVKKCKY